MDLMKELMVERDNPDPHQTDVGSWRGKAADAAEALVKEINNVRGEDPDSDHFNHKRAVKMTKYLKDLIKRLEKEAEKLKPLS